MSLTIVMYHYVRDLRIGRYPAIKGRDLAHFKGQFDHISRHFEVVSTDQVVASLKGEHELPDNAAWLTFDDGYLDHFTNVLPLLYDRKWHGAFFPPVNAVANGELLDVNKVHFILAAEPDTGRIVDTIRAFIESHSGQNGIRSFNAYWKEYAHTSRFDPAEVIFIKRVLQHSLPEAERKVLVDALFERFVSVDQEAFARELYMSTDQLRMMIQCGMYVGSHGAKHYWFDRLGATEQAAEIDAGLDLLHNLGAPTSDWVMCYPYGAHDDKLLSLLARKGCAVGLTTAVGVADLAIDDPLLLPRLDTNDLPII